MNAPQKITPPPEIAETLGLGTSRRHKLSRRNLLFAALAMATLLALYLFVFRGADDATSYVTEAVKRGAISETVTATGTVEPTNQVSISSELSGIVKEVLVDYNDRVVARQVLAVLDTDKLEAQTQHSRASLAVEQAQLQQAETTLEESRLAYERTRSLSERDYASQATRESAEATYQRAVAGVAVAQAQVAVTEATLHMDETNLSKATIRSPIDGVILSRDADPGQTVAASLQAPELFTVAETLASMQLEIDIDEADVGRVQEGQTVSFTVDAYQNRSFPAKVETVRYLPETTDNVVTYTGVLSLDNSDLLLRPGMTATADILVTQVDDALLIPNTALRFAPPEAAEASQGSGGGLVSMLMPRPPGDTGVARVEEAANGERTIYVLRNGAPESVSVRTGVTDGTWTEVLEGLLEPGDPVITDSTTAE